MSKVSGWRTKKRQPRTLKFPELIPRGRNLAKSTKAPVKMPDHWSSIHDAEDIQVGAAPTTQAQYFGQSTSAVKLLMG